MCIFMVASRQTLSIFPLSGIGVRVLGLPCLPHAKASPLCLECPVLCCPPGSSARSTFAFMVCDIQLGP